MYNIHYMYHYIITIYSLVYNLHVSTSTKRGRDHSSKSNAYLIGEEASFKDVHIHMTRNAR